jgi:hypothetical protein
MKNTITLTKDQQNVKSAFINFMLDPDETRFVISGYAGTGKSTLTSTLISELPAILKTVAVLDPNASQDDWDYYLTATTNKAAEALYHLTGVPVDTIHSFLGLRVENDYKNNTTSLVPTRKTQELSSLILFIDEASYIDMNLLVWINSLTKRCKVVFLGDPAQLAPVKKKNTPVFEQGYPTAELTEVIRQANGNPIIDLATRFRETVLTGKFFTFTPDGHHIQRLDRKQFEAEVIKEFTDPKWTSFKSKILAWTNKTVINYNHAINDLVKGTPNFQVGDYAVCNKYVRTVRCQLKTDQLVCITSIEDAVAHDIDGWKIGMNNRFYAFMPKCRQEWKKAINAIRKDPNADYSVIKEICDDWIDLRAAYSCTINKAQGSTYDKVFIDLDDIAKCRNYNLVARMLYVAVSRARHHVYFTGDLV